MIQMCLVIMVSSMSRLNKICIACGLLFYLFLGLTGFKFITFIKTPVEKGVLSADFDHVLTIKDRNGLVLAELSPHIGGYIQTVSLKQVPKHLIYALIATEDKRFYNHKGVDFIAVLRALRDNIRNRKIVSGGSTLTQQLVRMIKDSRRSYKDKVYESILALKYHNSFNKEEILTAYLNHAFLGNQIYGIGAGSEIYFNKDVSDLSISESAFLIGLLKSGTAYNPYKYFKKAEKRRKYVLNRLYEEGYIHKKDYLLAVKEGVSLKPLKRPFKAPHFCFYVRKKIKRRISNTKEIRTYLDYPLQKRIKQVIRNNVSRLKGLNVKNAAVVILNAQGELITMIGSVDYFNKDEAGQVNGTTALRQPGSSLKPFLYAYIFQKGHSPADVIGDIKTHLATESGVYAPVNYDKKYHGPVSIREALACSYNIPAVRWLYQYNYKEYHSFLKKFGFDSINKEPYFYGLAIALGTAEVPLIDLAQAYTVFSQNGYLVPLKSIRSIVTLKNQKKHFKRKKKKKIIDEKIAFLINHVLSDRHTRVKAFPSLRGILYPFDIAYKTGTSKDYRDAWVIGYDRKYVVGIWLGNFKGESMNRITGGNSAVPLLYDIFLELNPKLKNRTFIRPHGIITKRVCPVSGLIASDHCHHTVEEIFIQESEPKKRCSYHKLYVNRKKDREEYKVFTVLPQEYSKWCRENNWERPGGKWRLASKIKDKVPKKRVVKILSPGQGNVYRVDPVIPKEHQTIELEVDCPKETQYLEWYFNNQLWKRVKQDHFIRWPLQRGEQSIMVKAILNDGETIESPAVEILIQ